MPATIEMPTMLVVCAWCNIEMGEKQCDAIDAGAISHGICKPCARVQFENATV